MEGGLTHTLLEVLPDDTWQIDGAACDNGTDLLATNGQLFVGAGEIVTCTFTNSVAFVPAPAIDIIKTAANLADTDDPPDGVVNYPEFPKAGDTITYNFFVKNIGDEQAVTGNYPAAYMSTDTSNFENYYGNNQRQYIATPRTIGLALKYNF